MPHQRKPEFASWLGNGKEKTQAKCKLCHEVVELSNMYIQVLNIHQKGRKHISVVSSMSCFFGFFFFKSSVKGPPVSFEETTSKLNDSSSSKQQTLEISVLSSEKISAELMLALHCCLNGIFNNSNQDTSDLFQTKFPDSKIAKSFQMESNKIESSITDGLGLLMEHFNQPPLARCVF